MSARSKTCSAMLLVLGGAVPVGSGAALSGAAVLGCTSEQESSASVGVGAPVIATSEAGASRSAEVPDPVARAELLDHVPSAAARRPTSPDGGTRIGTESGLDGEELPEPPPKSSRPGLRVGQPRYQPMLSNPAIERAARAQVYWHLRKCTTSSGDAPPPESIALSFTLRSDGTVDPATVGAKPLDEGLDDVAECVGRTFSTLGFRGPAAAHGESPRVVVVWPSVD